MSKHLLEMIAEKMFRSGCGHDVNYAPDDFCPQCRIAELEAQLMACSDAAAMTDMKYDALVEGLRGLDRYENYYDEYQTGSACIKKSKEGWLFLVENVLELLGNKDDD